MFSNIALGSLFIILTGLIHTALSAVVLRYVHKRVKDSVSKTMFHALLRVDIAILLIISATILEAAVWAWGYLQVGALDHFEEAFYFSVITYTTLGYGDITLSDEWRLMASFEAANGIIMFGWSTSLVVPVIQNIKFKRKNELRRIVPEAGE